MQLEHDPASDLLVTNAIGLIAIVADSDTVAVGFWVATAYASRTTEHGSSPTDSPRRSREESPEHFQTWFEATFAAREAGEASERQTAMGCDRWPSDAR